MSGLKGSAKKAVETMTSSQRLDTAFRKFTKPTAEPGKVTYPASQRDFKILGFHWDRSDHKREVPDTRPGAKPGATRIANVFHWQAAAQAEAKSIKDWVKKHGSHSVITTVVVPEDASKDEFKALMAKAAEEL